MRVKKFMLFVLILAMVMGTAAYGAKKKMPDVIEGWFVAQRNARVVLLKDTSGREWNIRVDRNAVFEIDGRPVKLSNFRKGMEIYAEFNKGILRYLSSFSTENPGQEEEGRANRTGVVKYIDRDRLTLKFPTGDTEDFLLTPSTIVKKHSAAWRAEDLYEGDVVRVFLESEDSTVIQKIEVSSSGVEVKYLLRGTLAYADKYENLLVLKDEEVFVNGSWKLYSELKAEMEEKKPSGSSDSSNKSDGEKKSNDAEQQKNSTSKNEISENPVLSRIYYREGTSAVLTGQRIRPKDWNDYKGRTVYLVVVDDFGRPTADRIVIKSQYESVYQAKIEDVLPYQNLMELSNKKNIAWTDGTVYIRKNRILDMEDLETGLDALVISDGRKGSLTASLIYIYGNEMSNNNTGRELLYMGRLQTVVPETVVLKDFFYLNHHRWESFGGEKEFFFDDEIKVYNAEVKKEVGFRQFVAEAFSVDERTSSKGRDWYAYLWADGDRVSAAYVKKSSDSLLRQIITEGTVVQVQKGVVPKIGLTLQNARDYSERSDRWLLKNDKLLLIADDAFVIKNGKRILASDIQADDQVYVVRDGSRAIFILVRPK